MKGECNRLNPKRIEGNPILFKVLGLLIGHSLSNNGVGFDDLAPFVFHMLLGHGDDHVATKVNKDMLPLTSSTKGLLDLLDKLECSNDEETINDLICDDSVLEIINSSQWDPTAIKTNSKGALQDELIFNEFVRKRREEVRNIREGLAEIGLMKYISKNPQLSRIIFFKGRSKNDTTNVSLEH